MQMYKVSMERISSGESKTCYVNATSATMAEVTAEMNHRGYAATDSKLFTPKARVSRPVTILGN